MGRSGSSAAARNYAGVIQNYLQNVGLPVSIETSEFNVMLEFVRRGQFQMTYGQWVGGNQDPIFYRDLFATSEIPTETRAARNRSRYSNAELDQILAYYQSPVGKKDVRTSQIAMAQFSQAVNAQGQARVNASIGQLMTELKSVLAPK